MEVNGCCLVSAYALMHTLVVLPDWTGQEQHKSNISPPAPASFHLFTDKLFTLRICIIFSHSWVEG